MRFLALFLVLAAVFLVTATAHADNVGQLNADGYIVRGGGIFVWPADGTLWTRTQYQLPGSYGYGYRFGWHYHQYVAPVVAAPPKPDDPNFETKLLDYLAAKQTRQQRFDMLAAAGLTAPGGVYGAYGAGQLQSVTGTTLYGHSLSLSAGGYGPIDVNVMNQAYARAVERAQELNGQAVQGQLEILNTINQGAASVAEKLVLAELVKALQGKPVLERREFKFQSGGSVQPAPVEDDPQPAPLKSSKSIRPEWRILNSDCTACHSGKVKKNDFDVTKFDSLPRERRQEIFTKRINPKTADADHIMPRDEDGVGHALVPVKVKLWRERSNAL